MLGILVLLIIIGNMLPDAEDPEPTATPPHAATTESSPTATTEAPASASPSPEEETQSPTESPTQTETTASAEPKDDATLAGQVETALLEANAVDSFQALQPTSPGFYITGIEDVSTGTVRVHMQTELTDAERDDAAHWVMNMSCMKVEDLDTVVIRDTTGVDSNHFKRRMERVPPVCRD